MVKGEIYWLTDRRNNEITVGKKGFSEYKVPFVNLITMENIPSNMTPEQLYEFARKESQYVEFEEVSSDIGKQLVKMKY